VDTEATLLARIADGDDDARAVLADWWIEHGDEARGRFVHLQLARVDRPDDRELVPEQAALWRAHGERWSAFALAAGYPREQVVLARGFAALPLVVAREAPLTRELFQLSPLVYREERVLLDTGITRIVEARGLTTAGEQRRVRVESATADADPVVRKLLVHPDPSGTTDTLGNALCRTGRALVVPWGGVEVHELRERPLGPAVASAILCAVCDRLAGPHRRGQPHRAINPLNVLLADTGAVTLVNLNRHLDWSMRRRTRGYLEYLAPEQVRGLPADPRTDVFSCAMLCAALVTGVHPVRATTDFDRLVAIREGWFELPPLPGDLERVVRVALAQAPEDRYPTCGELAATLRGCSLELGPHVIAAAVAER
jgi:uncharacterized protein (TIGR02996 family)